MCNRGSATIPTEVLAESFQKLYECGQKEDEDHHIYSHNLAKVTWQGIVTLTHTIIFPYLGQRATP